MAKRTIDDVDIDVADANGEENPAKRPKTSDDEKSPHAGKTLVFFDLGARKGIDFPPKIFYQLSTKTYEILLHGLETAENDDDIAIEGDYGTECFISSENIKLAVSYDIDPASYMQAYKYFTEVLQQKLETHGLRISIR